MIGSQQGRDLVKAVHQQPLIPAAERGHRPLQTAGPLFCSPFPGGLQQAGAYGAVVVELQGKKARHPTRRRQDEADCAQAQLAAHHHGHTVGAVHGLPDKALGQKTAHRSNGAEIGMAGIEGMAIGPDGQRSPIRIIPIEANMQLRCGRPVASPGEIERSQVQVVNGHGAGRVGVGVTPGVGVSHASSGTGVTTGSPNSSSRRNTRIQSSTV